jgi:hypothetical protein
MFRLRKTRGRCFKCFLPHHNFCIICEHLFNLEEGPNLRALFSCCYSQCEMTCLKIWWLFLFKYRIKDIKKFLPILLLDFCMFNIKQKLCILWFFILKTILYLIIFNMNIILYQNNTLYKSSSGKIYMEKSVQHVVLIIPTTIIWLWKTKVYVHVWNCAVAGKFFSF